MISVDPATRIRLSDQALTPKRKFIFNSVDETGSVLSFPSISRSSDQITAGVAVVDVFNGNKYWNKIKANISTYLHKTGLIQMEISNSDSQYLNMWGHKKWGALKWYKGEAFSIFTGKLEDISFNDDLAYLTFKDKMGYIFERTIGSEDAPIDFYTAAGWLTRNYSSGINPADMIWYLMTDDDLGGLDDTASTANVDINYTQWLYWKAQMTTLGTLLKGNFTGQTIGEIITEVARLSHSTIYSEGDGLIYCRYWYNIVDPGGAGDFDTDNIFSKPKLSLNVSDVINRVTVYYGYNPVTGAWTNYRDKITTAGLEDTTSQGLYGIREEVYSNTSVWLIDAATADAFGQRIILWDKDPKQELEFDTGIMGFIHQLSDALRVNYPLYDIYYSTTEGYALKDITMNPMNGICNWKLRQMNFQSYFTLDNAVNGLLDETYNPLF